MIPRVSGVRMWVSLTACVVLVGVANCLAAVRLPRGPAAVIVGAQQSLPMDLAVRAEQATWQNDRGEVLPFPGEETDARGFVKRLSTRLVGTPGDYDNVLLTHPRWAAGGAIEGRFHLTIPADSIFEATVGFREGAAGTDGVTFQVWWQRGASAEPLGQKTVAYGRPAHLSIDLSSRAGQEGDLILRVTAGASSARDWAVWAGPRIAGKREHPAGAAVETSDVDRDGIPDRKEAELLARFRPYLLFTRGEDFRPCDAVWYIRHSSLKAVADEDAANVLPRETLAANPANLLGASKAGSDWGSSDLTRNPKRTRYCLNPGNQYRDGYEPGDGHDWPDIIRLGNIGLYGHVAPWRDYYQLSYWQFWGYSDTEGPLDIGDHEADWESIHLLVDPKTGWLVSTFHCAHGYEMVFDFTVEGISRQVVSLPIGDAVEFRGPHYDVSSFNMRTNHDRSCNNLVRFARDPETGEFTHPLVYIERNTHGSWPSEHWSYQVEVAGRDYAAPPHTGNLNPYLSSAPPNLGEVEGPLSDDAKVILRYNGRWGAYRGHAADEAGNDTPPGPQLHWQWVWPAGSALRARIPDDDFTDKRSLFRTR
jgi:hypothetical protein